MSISITSGQVITGGAQTGLTTPTYTVTTDVAPTTYGKQYAVTAIGGTQANVSLHSVSSPFTLTVVRPSSMKALPPVNPMTGLCMGPVPKNETRIIIRKGAGVLTNNPVQLGSVTLSIKVPAGADAYNSGNEIRAMLSLLVGVLNNQSSGIGDLVTTGII